MNPTTSIVVVHNMYGDQFAVRKDQLEGSRTFLRLHDPATGTPLVCEDPLTGPSTVLHRANICEHARESFQPVEILGDRWHQCPVCRARVESEAALLSTAKH